MKSVTDFSIQKKKKKTLTDFSHIHIILSAVIFLLVVCLKMFTFVMICELSLRLIYFYAHGIPWFNSNWEVN